MERGLYAVSAALFLETRYAATFELTYVVRNERRKAQAAGKSRIMVDLEIADGKPRVVRQKEIVGR